MKQTVSSRSHLLVQPARAGDREAVAPSRLFWGFWIGDSTGELLADGGRSEEGGTSEVAATELDGS